MTRKFVLFGILASILLSGSFGFLSTNTSFADDNLSVSRENSEAYQKQLEKQEEQKQKAEERKQKLEEKQEEQKQKAEERKQKLEEKQEKLDSDRKKLEEKLSKKINKYEEKLRKIKEQYQNKIKTNSSGEVEKFSRSDELEDKLGTKSEEIRKKLLEKQEKLDSRTQKILDKINDGDYLGDKISSSNSFETYKLNFDSVIATGIHDKTKLSTLEGFMIFNTFDKSNSNLKLELQECSIVVDDVPFNCGFGKARTISSGDSGSKDSLVVLAFLEDDILKEVYSTLKISLNTDSPISEITGSTQVSILDPQSKISGMWFLDGTGTLTKTVTTTDDTTENEISIELKEDIGLNEK